MPQRLTGRASRFFRRSWTTPGEWILPARACASPAWWTTAEPAKVHDPGNPLADADGYIYMSNVNPVDELVNMISASRSYQNSVEVLSTSKELLLRTLSIGQ